MKKTLLSIMALVAGLTTSSAISNNTVEVVFSTNSATVTVASNIADYITYEISGAHVTIVQDSLFEGINPTTSNTDGEIIYSLSGTSSDGEFYLSGSYKCTIELNGLTLTNPSGPALNIQNGKRIDLSAKKGTTNTLVDGANDGYNGCIHCKGHLKLKGKGTLTVTGNSKHAIYSKEYMEVKNLTLNIVSAVKDALHCKEYFLMESGTVNISSATDDAIQVELSGTTSTGTTTDHEDEDTGNFYMEGGTLTISSYGGKAVKADGTIAFTGGTQNFDTTDTETYSAIETVYSDQAGSEATVYDLQGRMTDGMKSGRIYIINTRIGSKKYFVK